MKITNTSELLSYLYSKTFDTNKLRFRGQANKKWKVVPSIYRYSNFKRYQTVFYEKYILKEKKSKPNPPLTHTTLDLEWLMLCQHYGIPTRLIDWTFDVLTALFFACYSDEEKNSDGSIIICNLSDYELFNEYNDSISNKQSLAFINTNIVNPRMHNQFGCFMMWGHSSISNNTTETYNLKEYQMHNGNIFFSDEIIIPASCKKLLLGELKEYYSITYDSLYIENGYIDRKYGSYLNELKEKARLYVFFITESSRLTLEEKKIARTYFGNCENMFGNCPNIRQIGI